MKTIESFIDRLANIPWLANLGKPSTRDDEVFRIYRWQTWPGPEDPGSEMQSAFQMKWKEELVSENWRMPGLATSRQARQDPG